MSPRVVVANPRLPASDKTNQRPNPGCCWGENPEREEQSEAVERIQLGRGILAKPREQRFSCVVLLVFITPVHAAGHNWLSLLIRLVGPTHASIPVLSFSSQAQEYLLRVLRLQPDNKEAWEDLGQCYLETGSLENSLEAYRRAVALVKGSDDSSSSGGK